MTSEVLTSSPRRVLRRRAVWIVVIAIVVLAAVALVIIQSSANASAARLDPTNPGPGGSRALAQVLEQHGVTVVPTDSLEATRAKVRDPSDTTILVFDPNALMTPEQRTALLGFGTDVVAVEPGLLALTEIAPGVDLAGQRSSTYSSDCDVAAVQKAGTVTGSGLGYRIDSLDTQTTACFTSKGVSGLVQQRDKSRSITVLGLGSTLENGTIAGRGDAALALNLLGSHHTLVWYIAGFADLQGGSGKTLAELTPNWVTPLLVLLAIA
ncbi:MAG: DUF4350 domain-containing protein, partial [Actinomycetota bacterium]|nr:DUF4350 domain-containing protein [Actinomycetota bacterium]